jgi:APA family basic amino acid/polyamine antiporter
LAVGLSRRLKFTRLVAITMGTPLASSVFLSISLICLSAGSIMNLITGILVATVLVLMTSLSYGELVSIYPSAAGNRVFLKKPLGNLFALGLSLMWVFVILGAAGVESFMVGNVLHFIFAGVPAILWAVLILTIVLIINIVGIEISGNFQLIVTSLVSITLASVFVFSIIFVKASYPANTTGFDLNSALTSAVIAVYFFLGFGRVTTLGEEALDYEKGIPRAMPVAIFLLSLVFILASVAIYGHVPLNVLQSTFIPQVVLGDYILKGTPVPLLLAIVSVVMSFSAFNAGVLGTSRLIYALGREGTFPKFLGSIHPRFHTPYASLILLYIITLGVLVYVFGTGNYSLPILVAAGFDSFMYALVGYSAFWHHRKGGEIVKIPFKVRGGTAIFLVTTLSFTILGVLFLLTSSIAVPAIIVLGTLAIIFFYRLRGVT